MVSIRKYKKAGTLRCKLCGIIGLCYWVILDGRPFYNNNWCHCDMCYSCFDDFLKADKSKSSILADKRVEEFLKNYN